MWRDPHRPKGVQRIWVPGPSLSDVRPAVRGRPQDGPDQPGRARPNPPARGRADGHPGHRPGDRGVPVTRGSSTGFSGTTPHRTPDRPQKVGRRPWTQRAVEFVGSKADGRWIWVVLDRDTRRVLGMVVGDRSADTARRLWDAIPDAARDGSLVYTNVLASYGAALPAGQHLAVGEETGQTATSSGSGRPSASGVPGSSPRPCRSRSASAIIWGHSGTSYDSTICATNKATTRTATGRPNSTAGSRSGSPPRSAR